MSVDGGTAVAAMAYERVARALVDAPEHCSTSADARRAATGGVRGSSEGVGNCDSGRRIRQPYSEAMRPLSASLGGLWPPLPMVYTVKK